MAERVVDVLEMIEIDIEQRGGRGARAHFLDDRFQPLAEENAVGQAAERVVHGEMAQARFTGGNGRSGAAHIAQYERGEQRKAGERDRDERHDTVHDLGARLLGRPGETRNQVAARVGEFVDEVAGRHGLIGDLTQLREPQLRGDLGQFLLIDEFERHQHRRALVGRRRTIAG